MDFRPDLLTEAFTFVSTFHHTVHVAPCGEQGMWLAATDGFVMGWVWVPAHDYLDEEVPPYPSVEDGISFEATADLLRLMPDQFSVVQLGLKGDVRGERLYLAAPLIHAEWPSGRGYKYGWPTLATSVDQRLADPTLPAEPSVLLGPSLLAKVGKAFDGLHGNPYVTTELGLRSEPVSFTAHVEWHSSRLRSVHVLAYRALLSPRFGGPSNVVSFMLQK